MTNFRLRTDQLLAFSLPNFVLGILLIPVGAVLPNLYAKETAVSLAAIGAVMSATRLFDAVSDQVVGYLSDLTHTRLGARLPWMLVGTPLLMVSSYFLFSPPRDATVLHFATWSFLFYFAYTLLAIPYLAWGCELSGNYTERSRIFAWHTVFSQIGGFLFFASPLLLFYAGITDVTEFSVPQMRHIALFAVMLLPLLMIYAAWRAPRSQPLERRRADLSGLMSAFRRNKPFRLFLFAYMVAVVGHGAFGGALIILVDSYLGLGDKLPLLLILMAATSLIAVYPSTRIIYRFGKHRPCAATWWMSSCILPLLMFVEPGQANSFLWLGLILFFYSIFDSLSNITPGAMMADIVDFELLRGGADRAGNFYALYNFVIKAAAAVGAGIGFMMLDGFGYSVKDPGSNTELANFGIVFTALFFPAALKSVGAIFIWRFPIDERRQQIIRRRVESLAARREAAQGAGPA